jgi:hypothetical protein
MRADQVALVPECSECERPWLPADEERWHAYLTDDQSAELALMDRRRHRRRLSRIASDVAWQPIPGAFAR